MIAPNFQISPSALNASEKHSKSAWTQNSPASNYVSNNLLSNNVMEDAYVANGNSTISVVNTQATSELQYVHLAQNAQTSTVVVTPNGSLLLVGTANNYGVAIFNTSTLTQCATIATPSTRDESNISISPNGFYAYVSGANTYNITVINLRTFSVSKVLNVSFDPGKVVFTPNGTMGFTFSKQAFGGGTSNTFSTINTTTNMVANHTDAWLNNPNAAAVSPNGSYIVIGNTGNATSTVMKINGFVNYYQIPLSVSPVSVAYNIKGTQIYFAGKATSGGPGQYMGAWAELYDGTDFLYLYSINLTRVNASSVSGMAVLPSSNLLLVSVKNPNSIAVVTIFSNGDGLSETGNLTQFQSPGQIAFFPSSYYGTFMISEKGLPAGKTWGIDIGGTTFSSRGTTLNATCYYGSLSYSLFSPNYYLFHNSTGTIVLAYSASFVYKAYFSLNFNQSRNYALFSNNATGTGAAVLSTINNTYLASLSSGTNIKSVAINPNGTLFLAVNQSKCCSVPIVTVTDMKTFTQVAKIPLPAEKGCVNHISVNPDGLYAYVGSCSYNLSVISLQTFSVTKVLNVSFDSSCVAFLPNGTEGFSLSAENYGCVGTPRNFTVINTVTNSVIENITNSNLSYSYGAAVSPNGSLLAIPSCQNLTIFNTKTLKEVKNFYNKTQYFCFGSDKFNQNGSILYVTANLFPSFPSHVIVYEIYTNNYSVRVLTNTTGIKSSYFAFTGNGKYMYLPGSNSGSINNVQELSSVNGSVMATAHVEIGCQNTVIIPASAYFGSVNFKETGLPANVPWSLELNGLKYQSTGSEITAYSYTGVQSYTINTPSGFYLEQNATGSTLVTYKNNTINLSFLAGVSFTETGLGTNPIWYLNITNLQNSGKINSNTYATNVPLGSSEAIATSPDAQAYYLNFTINRPGEAFMIPFKAYYHFSVTQSGLTNNNWYLNVTNKSGYRFETYGKLSNLTLNLINGSYSYTISTSQKTYAPSTYSGIFTINGASVTDTVTFKEILYTVYFNETGLPTGTSWYVILNGNNSTSSSSSIAFTSTNGTLSFTIGSTSGYKTNESSGYIIVNGSNTTLRISFYQPPVKSPSGNVIPPLLEYLAVAAVIAIAIIGAIIYRRRNP